MVVDVITTACARPDLLEPTYRSFQKNLHGIDWDQCRLWINVDPKPADDVRRMEAGGMGYRFFGSVTMKFPATANFGAAVKWLWSRPFESAYVLNLEDDWELREPINARVLVNFLANDPGLSCVNLRVYERFRETGGRLLLSPGLWRASVLNEIAPKLDPVKNPEHNLWEFRGYQRRYYPQHQVCFDTGREWLEQNGWEKNAPSKFTTWERKTA